MSKMNKLDSMMIEIVEEGEETVLKGIEMILNPTQRFQERNIFYKALGKLKQKFKGE